MKAAQGQRKHIAILLAQVVVAFAVLGALPQPLFAVTNEQIVSDPQSGLAIGGYDPVAYFTEGQPREGRDRFEKAYAGVVWRFDNAGNRAAFTDDPEVYMPSFGGYDPVALARGASVPGQPSSWMLVGRKLFLFYDDSSRAAFAVEPARFIAQATRRWPEVRRHLAR